MFSLIIIIISIALVGVLVAATMYNGGDTLSEAKAQADATRLKNQEQQILAAVDFFQAEHNRFPEDLGELVTTGFLRSIPVGLSADSEVAILTLMPEAVASDAGWVTPVTGQPVFQTATNVPRKTCSKFNQASRGDDGILRGAYDTLRSQCYGEDGNYRVIIYKSGAINLSDVLGGDVLPGAIPPVSDSGWDTAPSGAPVSPGTPGEVPGTTPDPDPDPTPEPEPEPMRSAGVLLSGSTVAISNWKDYTYPIETLTYQNTGNAPMSLSPGGVSAPLSVIGNTCNNVAVGGTCEVILQLATGDMGESTATLNMTGADTNPEAVSINWKVMATVARWGTATIDFGATPVNTPVTRSVALFNDGNEPASWAGSLIGNLPAQFSVSMVDCASVLAGGSCNVGLTFNPIAAQTYNATGLAVSNASTINNHLTLGGVGEVAQ